MLKSLLRAFFINLIAFWLLSNFTGIVTIGSLKSLIVVSITLTLADAIARPVLKLITLPLNILTLGLFSGVITLVILYFVVTLVPGIYISGLTIPGFSGSGFVIPEIHLSRLETLIILAAALSLVHKTLNWVIH